MSVPFFREEGEAFTGRVTTGKTRQFRQWRRRGFAGGRLILTNLGLRNLTEKALEPGEGRELPIISQRQRAS